ncbi:MAG: hypothetical protein WB005_15380 [Pseudolabrys sp.]
MARADLKQMTRTPEAKLGHFIVEFATPGIGHILKQAGCDFDFRPGAFRFWLRRGRATWVRKGS